MSEKLSISRNNNFDLIRIFAALQVVIWHGAEHLNLGGQIYGMSFLKYFPGVPIFFVISGFLITASFQRNPNYINYFKNRALRIFPGLWVAFIVLFIILVLTSSVDFSSFISSEMILWVFAQLSLFQFWTPDILRNWGVGAPNGSLWTIPVEIGFYILVPLFFMIARKNKLKLRVILFTGLIFGIVINMYGSGLGTDAIYRKLLAVSVFPYLHYFLIGALIYHYWPQLKKYIEGRILFWALFYFFYTIIFSVNLVLYQPSYWPNAYGLISIIILSFVVISAAFSYPNFSSRLLNGNDLSYGTYIYHMIVINVLVQYGYVGNIIYLLGGIAITLLLAFLSWVFVEKPALSFKIALKK